MAKRLDRNPYFGNSVRMLRSQYDMSQEDFAIALGIDPSRSKNLSAMVSGWERGDREPSLETVCRICRRFGVTADWLLGLEETTGSEFSRKAKLMLLRGENSISEEDKIKLLKILEAFTQV